MFLVSLSVTMGPEEIKTMLTSLSQGDKRTLARAITLVENEAEGSEGLLKEIHPREIPVIGFTGPPGAGKSTLISAFLKKIIAENKKAAVVAIDPTSPFNFGSLLGDRLRMAEHFTNENIFIRSVASRGSLGGLCEKIIEICDVLRSSDFDYILIETVGVGQSEVEIAGLADTTVVILVPESGDDIQALKSGIMEIADIFIVNKSDREGASLFSNNLKSILAHRSNSEKEIPVINAIATKGEGIDKIFHAISGHKSSKEYNEKKLFLMAEKAYRLISKKRMAGLSIQKIFQMLQKQTKEPGFNLYRFVDQFKN